MKVWTWLILLFLLCFERNLMAQNSDNQPLWLLTTKVTNNSTFRRDTVKSFMAGDKLWKEEKHASGRSTSTGTVTVVIENQADDPLNDFWFDSSAGDPKPMIVTGSGSSFHSSSYIETIDGKLISGDKENGEVSGKAFPGATVMFNFTNDSKFVEVIIGIDGVANSKRQRFRDGEWVDYGSTYNYHITCSGGGEAPSANCKITKTGKGFQASWKKSETKQRSTVDGMEYTTSDATLEVTISPYKESDKPEITLLGCTNLEVGGQSMVVATGKPVGGTFRFWAEPSSMMTVETDGSSANVTGASPEKGTFFAEYTTIDGKTAQTSQVASCVKVEKYNGGQPIPQIALYDIDGKKLPGIKTVPVDAQPTNSAELVKFEPADPGVISALGVGSEVTLQGLRAGTTTLQAKTNCGEDTGPAVEVEVVNCDDETIATLERMKKAALENLVEATEQLQKTAGSPEFEKARDELVSSTIELLAKAGLTIFANGKTSGAVKVAAEIADKGSALSEIIASSNPEELKNNIGKTASGESFEKIVEKQFGEAVGELWGKSLSAAIGVAEVQQAAQKFGDNIGEILKHEDVMKGLADNYEQAMRNFDRISKRLNVCKEGTEQPQSKEQPKPDPAPKPTDPTPPKDPTPKTEPKKGEQPQPTEPTPTEPTADDEVIGDPEPPVVPPKQVGLPYEPADCGCGKTKDLTVKSADFAAMGAGMKNLGECVEDFKTTSLDDYQLALQDMSALTDSLSTSLKTNAEAFLVKAKASKPRLDELVSRVKSYDKAGTEFLNKMEKCPETVTTGMEIFQSVEKITVDSIKTNY